MGAAKGLVKHSSRISNHIASTYRRDDEESKTVIYLCGQEKECMSVNGPHKRRDNENSGGTKRTRCSSIRGLPCP